MKTIPCILCRLLSPVLRRNRQLSAWLTSRKYHLPGFFFAAKIGPVAWLLSSTVVFCGYSVWILDHVLGGWKQCALIAVGAVIGYWLNLFWVVTPDVNNRGVLCNVAGDRGMSVHLEGNMSAIVLEKGASSALKLARRIGARHIDLRSPLFGRDGKEELWLNWLKKIIGQLAPNAKVEVVGRDPFGRYASFLYQCHYGANAPATVKDGLVQAACFRITGF